MIRILALLAALWAGPAFAQTGSTVKQSGLVTPTHVACWTTNGTIQDCGTSPIPFASAFGITSAGNNGICVNSAAVSVPYNQFCIGNSGSNGIISFFNLGGQTPGSIFFDINGTIFPLATIAASVTSITNADGTLTIAPNVGAVVASLNPAHANVWSGQQTFGQPIVLNGATSGQTTFAVPATASGTLTFPALTDNVLTATSTNTLTNKTFDTAGTGNSFKINGNAITAISGNTATVGTSSGALTNGDCVSINAGNFVDAGGPCTVGGGGGTVTAGTAGQMTYYATSSTVVSGNANATISNGALTLVPLVVKTFGPL